MAMYLCMYEAVIHSYSKAYFEMPWPLLRHQASRTLDYKVKRKTKDKTSLQDIKAFSKNIYQALREGTTTIIIIIYFASQKMLVMKMR